ncbi:kinesin-domain-containing protein, partial [Anaeromyces robustus]
SKNNNDNPISLPLLDSKNFNITTSKSIQKISPASKNTSFHHDKKSVLTSSLSSSSSSSSSMKKFKKGKGLINDIISNSGMLENYTRNYKKTSAGSKSDISKIRYDTIDEEELDLDSKEDTISVYIRIRPFNDNEVKKGYEKAVFCEEDKRTIKLNCPGGKQRSMMYHSICDSYYSQEQMFEELNIKSLLDSALIGHHITLFAFGQTGSGKTYTINGLLTHPEYYGIMPRSFEYIYDKINSQNERKYSIKATYFEIYNEKIKDLLNPTNTSLPVRWCRNRGFYVESLVEQNCNKFEDCLDLLKLGNSNKSIGKHLLNDYSSRSHCILTLNIYSASKSNKSKLSIRQGKIHFVDLAGNEKVKESQTTGDSLVETMSINKSLLALGNCISALSDPKKREGHIPYRDSKLTKILSDSLSGKGLTIMISCISPSNHDIYETLKTLRYSSRAKHIKYKSIIKLNPEEEVNYIYIYIHIKII